MLTRSVSSFPSDNTKKEKDSQCNENGILKTKDYWAETFTNSTLADLWLQLLTCVQMRTQIHKLMLLKAVVCFFLERFF